MDAHTINAGGPGRRDKDLWCVSGITRMLWQQFCLFLWSSYDQRNKQYRGERERQRTENQYDPKLDLPRLARMMSYQISDLCCCHLRTFFFFVGVTFGDLWTLIRRGEKSPSSTGQPSSHAGRINHVWVATHTPEIPTPANRQLYV